MKPALGIRLIRLLPAVLVALVLLLVLAAPFRSVNARASARSAPVPDYVLGCEVVQQGDFATLTDVAVGDAVVQPIVPFGTVSVCSLTTAPSSYSLLRLDVVVWNPAQLVSDPTTIALRSLEFDVSVSSYNKGVTNFNNPVVTRSLSNVAEPPRFSTAAIEFHVMSYGSLPVGWDDNGPPSCPTAYALPSGGVSTPLPGAHPVLSHLLCGGDAADQALQVVQCVMTTNSLSPGSGGDLIQKFRVPVATTIQSVEVATGASFGASGYGLILILDAVGQDLPPATYGSPLFSANYIPAVSGRAAWTTDFGSSLVPTLAPHHDYWLVVNTGPNYQLYMRDLTGAENPYFTSTIGPLFSRSSPGAPTALIPGRALDFRLIGTPVAPVSVGQPAPLTRGLELSSFPNPARGPVTVFWSHATGGVNLEVLDASGRRVDSGTTGASDNGQWTWRATDDRGAALGTGVYFVRAVDGSGLRAMRRVVLVR